MSKSGTFVYCPIEDRLIPKEVRLMEDYLKKGHLHMTKPGSNEKVSLYYNSDHMEPTRHMINGKYYTSKKKYRDETKAHNCVEIGNETKTVLTPKKPIQLDRRQRRDSIKKAIHDLRNGKAPRSL